MGYRVAILGCRGRGTAAGRAYHGHPDTEVVAVCDLLQERRDALGDTLDVKARYEDLDKMMKEVRPDLVAIPTGTEFHFDLGMRVLDYGAHIDIEKPICVDLEQADTLLARAEKKGVQIAVHHQGRTGAAMRAVKAAFESGKIGELHYVSASGKGYYGGYGLMNIVTHVVNAILELAGPCRSITAYATTNGKPSSPKDVVRSPNGMGTIMGENLTASFGFDGGVTGTLTQHRFPVVDSRAYHAEFFGSEGRLYWGSSSALWLPEPHAVPGENAQWESIATSIPELPSDGPAALDDLLFVDEYVQALTEGRPHACSGDAGVHVLEVLMACFESAAYGSRVELPQSGRDHPLVRWQREHGLTSPEMPRPYFEWLEAEDERLGRSA